MATVTVTSVGRCQHMGFQEATRHPEQDDERRGRTMGTSYDSRGAEIDDKRDGSEQRQGILKRDPEQRRAEVTQNEPYGPALIGDGERQGASVLRDRGHGKGNHSGQHAPTVEVNPAYEYMHAYISNKHIALNQPRKIISNRNM